MLVVHPAVADRLGERSAEPAASSASSAIASAEAERRAAAPGRPAACQKTGSASTLPAAAPVAEPAGRARGDGGADAEQRRRRAPCRPARARRRRPGSRRAPAGDERRDRGEACRAPTPRSSSPARPRRAAARAPGRAASRRLRAPGRSRMSARVEAVCGARSICTFGSQPQHRAAGTSSSRPSSFIVAGSSTPRMIVASISTATARPTPICLMSSVESVAKIANTATITSAALVTVLAVVRMPRSTASSVDRPPIDELLDPADDEHVVVHREAEQHREQEQRQPGDDAAVRVEAEQPLQVALLEDPDEHAVGGADREQVEHDRLERDHDRAERHQQQQERQPEHEREHDRRAVAHGRR